MNPNFDQAIDLARRYHFMLLNVIVADGKTSTTNRAEVQETFRLYEQMVDTIHQGKLPTDKLAILQALPVFDQFVETPNIDQISRDAKVKFES